MRKALVQLLFKVELDSLLEVDKIYKKTQDKLVSFTKSALEDYYELVQSSYNMTYENLPGDRQRTLEQDLDLLIKRQQGLYRMPPVFEGSGNRIIPISGITCSIITADLKKDYYSYRLNFLSGQVSLIDSIGEFLILDYGNCFKSEPPYNGLITLRFGSNMNFEYYDPIA